MVVNIELRFTDIYTYKFENFIILSYPGLL